VPVQCPTRFVERVTGVGDGAGAETVDPGDDEAGVGFAEGCAGAVTGGRISGAHNTGLFNVTSGPGEDSTRRGSSGSTSVGTYDIENTFD